MDHQQPFETELIVITAHSNTSQNQHIGIIIGHFLVTPRSEPPSNLGVLFDYTVYKMSSHFCWFNFDALAQGNAYKPTKEPINYRGPGGDRTHDLQTEATPPAASCPARTLHATEIAPKTQLQ